MEESSNTTHTWSRVTLLQRLTSATKLAVNRSKCILKLIEIDAVKIMASTVEYHKTIIDIPQEKNVEFHIYEGRQQRRYRVVMGNL
jgi:hypothetical protein